MDIFAFETLDIKRDEECLKEKKLIKTKGREQILDLDSHPIPNRRLIDYEKYNSHIGISMAKSTIVMQATRGCPFRCAYCHQIWPKKQVQRSAQHIFEELNMYYEIGYYRFAFIDDCFNLNRKNSSEFFQMILDHGLKVQLFFPNGMRGDILTKGYIDLMVKAGVVELPLALETAVPRLQTLIQKNLKIQRLQENINYFVEKYPHVILELFTMHGIPTETEEEAMKTFNFINDVKWLHFPYVNILRLYPGTALSAIAIENGVSEEDIINDTSLAFHEVPNTIPFSKGFARTYQSRVMYEYIMNTERLKHVIPLQRLTLTEDEMVQKYNSYFPFDVEDFDSLLEIAGISRNDLNEEKFIADDWGKVENANEKIANLHQLPKVDGDALKILFIDASQYFSKDNQSKLYDMMEIPLGHVYILSYLYDEIPGKVDGKIMKSRMDFDSYEELIEEVEKFSPDVIGLRTLTYFKSFFQKIVKKLRESGYKKTIIAGGPYATSSYEEMLRENEVDVACLGEGERTMLELVHHIIDNDKKLPSKEILSKINGIAYLE